jgi:peptidyl-prolyl cis-trans isomerase SurA
MKRSHLIPAIFVLAFAASAYSQTVVEEIVARINDQIVTRSDLERSKQQMESELKQQDPANAEKKIAEREKNTLRDLIDQQLLVSRAKDLGITGDTELIKRLDEIRKQLGLEKMEDLEQAAQQQGVSFEDFKKTQRDSIVTQAVIQQEVQPKIHIAPSEAHEYYLAHKQDFAQPEQLHLAEILFSTEKDAGQLSTTALPQDSANRAAAAEAKAKQVMEELRKGGKFEDLAKKYSEDSTASQGGDLGYFKRGMLAKEIEDKIWALKPGETTDVIRTKQGFIILKALEHIDAGTPSEKELEQQIYEAIYLKKLQPTLRAYLTKLREDAYIDIKQGFVDTGASPNQTKPVFTTVASNEGKKLKRKKKLGVF